jgi:predicted regulator of Ras-like GTPase activity (Roadblock/LC7/MglB family)
MLPRVDAAQALADLTEISSQVVQVAILDADGALLATTIADDDRARAFAAGVLGLADEAGRAGGTQGLADFAQLEAATGDGSVFLVREPAGTKLIAATTLPDPTVGLVFYDLKHCLQSIDPPPAPKRAPRQKKADAAK